MTTTYVSGGKSISAELFSQAVTARGAAVVIAHGADGVTDDRNGPWATMMREYGADFARAGYTALLPHYFDRTGTEPKEALAAMSNHMPAWQQALSDALAHAATLPRVAAGQVGLVGFSLGGHLSLRLRDRVPVLVEFFAPLLHTGIGLVSSCANYVQIHDGTADPIAEADLIAKVLKTAGITAELHRYPGAGQGFQGQAFSVSRHPAHSRGCGWRPLAGESPFIP